MTAWKMYVADMSSLTKAQIYIPQTELLDAYGSITLHSAQSRADDERIGINESSFAWSTDFDGSLTPSKRDYILKIECELIFKPSCLNIIVGPTGSGKTSMLMALLGEMHYIPNGPNSWFNLPRRDGVAYAAQESWILNETIKVCLAVVYFIFTFSWGLLGEHIVWVSIRRETLLQGTLPVRLGT
jgi:ABC-type uncharacterized transport system fused permease/ATPase subunit